MTDAIVLAAGLGRRLARATALPKWLTPVGPTCPAEVQLSAFEAAGIEQTLVVVGPGASEIGDVVAPWRGRLSVELVPNHRSADRNNWYSLLLGLAAWAEGGSDDVVVVNSDLFASPGWFKELVTSITALGTGAGLAVDRSRGRTDEAMKVAVSQELVTGIGKVGIPDPDGEYVGLSWFDRAAAAGLLEELHAFEDQPARADHWYEHGIQEHISAGARYRSVAVPSSDWVEIDDETDLVAARALGV